MMGWDLYLPVAQFAVNSAWRKTTQQIPFFFNQGRAPKTPLDILLPPRTVIESPASCQSAQRFAPNCGKSYESHFGCTATAWLL